VAAEDPLFVAAVTVDETEAEAEAEDVCTLPAPVAALVNEDNNEEEDTCTALALVALDELVSLIVPLAPAALVAPEPVERVDPFSAAMAALVVPDSVEVVSSLSAVGKLSELVEVPTIVLLGPAAAAPGEVEELSVEPDAVTESLVLCSLDVCPTPSEAEDSAKLVEALPRVSVAVTGQIVV
jgi:hypothetical protein